MSSSSKMNNTNDDLPNILNITDDYTYATFYHKYFDSGKYIYSTHTGAWFCYDKDNVLKLSSTKTPFRLKNEICKHFVSHFRNLQQQLREHDAERYDAINKTIKHVGSTSFADSIITFLRPMNSNDNLESLIDNNQNLIAFNNGVVFDVKTNTYRNIEKDDFISKTMSIPFNEQVDEEATEAIYNIVSSFFEDPLITNYFLTVLGVSLFTTKHEKLNILTGNGRNGKSLIMNYLNNILGDYATVAESDLLTSKMKNGVSCSLVNARNTRMILVSEPSSEDGKELKLNNTLIKSITGNDRITARALYQNTISFDPTFNVFMLCNEIPSLEKVEKAMIERLNIIKFEFTFVGADDLDKHPNNRLIDKDLKKTLKENTEMKQAFIQLLFKYAFETSKS